jgi:hypothetical protein
MRLVLSALKEADSVRARRIIVQSVVTNRSERASAKTRVLFPARRNYHPRLQPTDAFTIILTTLSRLLFRLCRLKRGAAAWK